MTDRLQLAPGVLAYIIRSQWPENIGRVVEVKSHPAIGELYDIINDGLFRGWFVEIDAPWLPPVPDCFRGPYWCCEISKLRPIAPPPVTSEIDVARDLEVLEPA